MGCQIGAALLLGLAISGMHYVGMAAANIPHGAVSHSTSAMLTVNNMESLVIIASVLLAVLLSFGFMFTIAARLELSKSLRAANESLRAANTELQQRALERDRYFNQSFNCLAVAGFDGCFKRLNPAWEADFGLRVEELAGKPFLNVIDPGAQSCPASFSSRVTW